MARKRSISFADLILDPNSLMGVVEGSLYDKVDGQPVSASLKLRSGLSRYPLAWIDAVCQALGLPPVRLKKEKIDAAVDALLEPDRLRSIVDGLPTGARDALRYVVGAGGWVKYASLSRRFGNEDQDSYFWSECPPKSAIGQLRVRGLLFVGRMAVEGKTWKVAVVPQELRRYLAEWL